MTQPLKKSNIINNSICHFYRCILIPGGIFDVISYPGSADTDLLRESTVSNAHSTRLHEEKSLILALLLSAALFFVACFLAADRSVWSDEGMYLSNMHQHWWHYFKPLPYYDQACPPLVSVLYSLIFDSVPTIFLFRLTILFIFSLALAYFGRQAAK